MLARWLDRELASDIGASLSAAHAARVGQLTKARTRRALARSLDRLVERADDRPSRPPSWTIQPCTEQVRAAMPLILSTASRLRSDESLSPIGIARLKTLLRDASGPCYVRSRPDALTVALEDVSHALEIETGGRRPAAGGRPDDETGGIPNPNKISIVADTFSHPSRFMTVHSRRTLVKQTLDRLSLRYAPYPTAPEFIYNSVNDDIAFVAPVDALVTQYCAAGVTVDYDRDALGGDHISAIPSWWAGSLAYLIGRYADDPAPDDCATWSSSLPTP